MNEHTDLRSIRLITVSGRIASGSTTLASGIAKALEWKHIEGGEIFWEAVRRKLGLKAEDTNLRPDDEDKLFDAQLRKILLEDRNIVLETKLAAFNAQGIEGVFKVLAVCEDNEGVDQTQLRIDRLVNREGISVEDAKREVVLRENNDIAKWRKLYANENPEWVYWDRKYYDLVVNTYSLNAEESTHTVLNALNLKK